MGGQWWDEGQLTCCKSEKGMGSLASTWWGWLVRDGSGGSFFQWVRLLLSTARRVLAEGGVGWRVRPQSALLCLAQPRQVSLRPEKQGDGASAHHKLTQGSPLLAPLTVQRVVSYFPFCSPQTSPQTELCSLIPLHLHSPPFSH